jgi:hypothetical protein
VATEVEEQVGAAVGAVVVADGPDIAPPASESSDRMPRERRDSETARITPLCKLFLSELVDQLATSSPVLLVSEPDLVGALVYAARRSPPETIKAVIAYRDLENEVAAAEATGAFLRGCVANLGEIQPHDRAS